MFKKKNSFFNFLPKKSKNKPQTAHQEIIFLISSMFKKLAIIIGAIVLPIFIAFIVIIATIIAVINWINPFQNYGVFQPIANHLPSANGMPGGIIDDVISSIMALLYVIFISPILFILKILQDIVYFIGGGKLATALLFGNGGSWNGVPTLVFVVLGFALGILAVIIVIRFIEIQITEKNKGEKIVSTLKNIVILVPLIIAIPISFFVCNMIIATVTQLFILDSNSQANDLGLFIFNASFTNGMHYFTEVPGGWSFEDNAHFGWLQCLVSEAFMTYILLQVSIFLFWNVAEQLILLVIGSLTVVAMVKDEGRTFFKWKDLTINRFLSFTVIFLVYNIFLSGIPVLTEIGNLTPVYVRPLFVTVGIIAFGMSIIKAPTLLSNIIGQDVRKLNVGNGLLMRAGGLAVSGASRSGREIVKSPVTLYHGASKSIAAVSAARDVGFKKVIKAAATKNHKDNYKEYKKKYDELVKVEKPESKGGNDGESE